LFALNVVGGVDCIQIGRHWCFCIDDDLLGVGKTDDHVGAGSVAIAGDVFLLFVHDVFSHAGEFDDALELELTPVAAHFGVLHGRCEFGCFLLQGSGERRERTDAGVQATGIFDTFVFELVEFLVEPRKLFADGGDKVVHGLLLL